jgi:hypothetical protein
MPSWGKCDFSDWKNFERKLGMLGQMDMEQFCIAVSKELAGRLLSHLIKRTPVAKSTPSHKGGTLRRGWTAGVSGGAAGYASGLDVEKTGNTYRIMLENPVEYGIYVNYGHRTRSGGWVPGQYFLELAVDEVQPGVEKVIEKKMQQLFAGMFS